MKANLNGYNTVTTARQIIIGDALRGTDESKRGQERRIRKSENRLAIMDADVFISPAHFWAGHEMTALAAPSRILAYSSQRGKMNSIRRANRR